VSDADPRIGQVQRAAYSLTLTITDAQAVADNLLTKADTMTFNGTLTACCRNQRHHHERLRRRTTKSVTIATTSTRSRSPFARRAAERH